MLLLVSGLFVCDTFLYSLFINNYMGEKEQLEKFKEAFAAELKGIGDIDALKDLYASEIARRDVLITRLREQNELLLKSMMKSKVDEIKNAH
jgi:hypothetical protein